MKTTKFKPSEVGPIPEEWEVCELGSLWENFRTGPFGSSLHAQDYVTGGTPLVNPMHIQDGKIMPTLDMTVDKATERRLSAYRLSKDDIIIGRRGEMGRAALVGEKETGWLCGTGCFFLRMKDRVCPDYVVRYLRTPACVSVLEGEAVGTTLVNLNQTILGRVNIPVPPLPEQEKIAEALSDVDALLAAMTTLIEKKRAIKQGAMQQLLTGKKRLAGFSGKWVEKRIGDMTDVITGATPSTEQPDYWGGDIRWMSSGELNDKIVSEVSGRITKKGFDACSTHMIPVGCVLIGLAGQGKTRGTAAYNLVEMCTNQSIASILPNPCVDSKFLYYYMDRQYDDLRLISAGDGGRGGLTKGQIEKYHVRIPPMMLEQKAISEVLSDMDAEIAALESKRAKYERIKRGMMQKLLTGKKRFV